MGCSDSTTETMKKLVITSTGLPPSAGDEKTDTRALSAFLSGLQAAPRVNWLLNVSVCEWQGVICNANKRVESLHLPGVGLTGRIPEGVLGSLSELRVLSLRSNKLSGPLPPDLANCTQLRSLYLQHNELSGSLPPLSSLPPLIRLNLAYNKFSDVIPSSYSLLRRLGTLYLQNNSLSGSLPGFISLLPNLTQFSVANNTFNGSVAASLQERFDASAFEGNHFCGKPLFEQCANAPISSPAEAPTETQKSRRSKHRLTKGYIAAIAAGAAALAFFILACCVVWCLKRRGWSTTRLKARKSVGEAGGTSTQKALDTGKGEVEFSSAAEKESNKLVFFDGGTSTFDLEDLLRASAEVLGKGSIGTAYKAVLEDGTTVVVKRLKDVSVGRKEFEQHIGSLGNLRHRHLVPLRAYYYSKDEKLLLFQHMALGSLSALLHGNRGSGRTALDWDTRVKIATGAAKGIAFLHEQGGGNKFTHGNIKSSNVLLSRNYDASISDYSLMPLFGTSPIASRILGYRAPEVLETRRITSKADVYSYGVLLLELLTGKAPTQTSSEEGIDLPRWVQSVVREEWTAEVFDVELLRYDNIEEEMVQILQIAMACVAVSPDQRPTMSQVVKMIEDVRAFETDDTIRQSSSDKSKESNGHTPQRTEPSTPARITP
ncbi:hypothetical protein GOP47_0022500 [Adiantum capillus-veneris]|uniref:Protein kinase domain-containing protein n=1 Tax=Adiantum capillus-veneris TaxID=13818 RepID=A0A9D4Z6W7_ADICA|nr:hypothetical protein GOP47_0022500 [Adiantum capillus-veneris]